MEIKDLDSFCEEAGIVGKDGNPVRFEDDDVELSDYLFESTEASIFQSAHPELFIWTLVTGDESDWLNSGFHYVNRLGYIFTTTNPKDAAFDKVREADGDVLLLWWNGQESDEVE